MFYLDEKKVTQEASFLGLASNPFPIRLGGIAMPVDVSTLKIYRAGVSAVIAALCDTLRIPKIIDGEVEWDQAQCRLSPGTRVKALLINILVHRRALNRVERFFRDQDMEILFGSDMQVRAEELNDDALGRVLDKLSASDPKTIFSSVALNAAAMHNVPLDGLHVDTTSISVQGQYDGDGELDITFGYSKDHRPDLKQFMIGLTVTREGLPILGRSLNGNTSVVSQGNQRTGGQAEPRKTQRGNIRCRFRSGNHR